MSVARQQLGRRVEELVADELERRGWRILERNARVRALRGEIDLVALDCGELVFVEVKARRAGAGRGPEAPALAVGPAKQAKLRSLALAWLHERAAAIPRNSGLRFDVVGVRTGAAGEVLETEHLRGAF